MRADKIAALNDMLRTTFLGGEVFITQGISALGGKFTSAVVEAVQKFTDFTADNDPYGEHDCAVLEVEGVRVIFKTDYYSKDKQSASDDPSDPSITCRVLTIMCADEY